MQPPLHYRLENQDLWLSAHRAIYWEQQKTLVVSDLHFGKTGHFRKSGVAVPQEVYKEDLQRLLNLLQHFNPLTLLVVGDFFHSHMNSELEWFKKWRNDFPALQIDLVRGNHDILNLKWYAEAGIKMFDDTLDLPPFSFRHEQCDDNEFYTFCGHLHPGVILNGLGKQSLRFPCFYFSERQAILPAFSRFTGLATVNVNKGDDVFIIVEEKLVKL
jgi:uncharacterized protein